MNPPRVETRFGTLEGQDCRTHLAFRGVPYAKPPCGRLRFRAPEPPEPWPGIRAATSFGNAAPQGASFVPGVLAEGPQSEDCLTLNVYTPATQGRTRPVLLWLHGGAFTVGSAAAPLYDGGRLAELGNVVVVTANYRIGALGYLYLGEYATPIDARENRGLLDQLAALRWVHENIEAFGGDPRRVTLFGESAGGTSVCLLMAATVARGQFQRAISQSSLAPLTVDTPDKAAKTTHAFMSALGLSSADAGRLQELPIEELMRAQAIVEAESRAWPHFYPVLDPVTLPVHPRDMLSAPDLGPVPLLIGTNRDEWNLFVAGSVARWDEPLEHATALARLEQKLPLGAKHAAAELLRVYRESRVARGLRHDTRALLRAIEGDLWFRVPNIRFAEACLAHQPSTFMYLFTYESPALRGALGACHALEIPFVFGTLDSPLQERFAGTGPEVEALSRTMMGTWLEFANGADPFSAYELSGRPTMVFDRTSGLAFTPHDEERQAWNGLL